MFKRKKWTRSSSKKIFYKAPDKNVMYVSRRNRDFEDHNSEDEENSNDIDEMQNLFRRSGKDASSSIHYRDTQGNQIITKPN